MDCWKRYEFRTWEFVSVHICFSVVTFVLVQSLYYSAVSSFGSTTDEFFLKWSFRNVRLQLHLYLFLLI